MQVIQFPDKADWALFLKRPVFDMNALETTVLEVLQTVKQNGDAAIRTYTEKFDGVVVENTKVSQVEIDAALSVISKELKEAIDLAAKNIEIFHAKQLQPVDVVETMPGVQCWRKSIGIEKVGLYIPGGSAPLFSTILMLGIPAKLAGCKEIVLCSPPNKEGQLHPAILYAAQLVGIHKVFKVGGVQAIAAMSFGTVTIPPVYKIFGPGNQYVTCAKQLIQKYGVAIDMPAGPSEVCVMADETCNPKFVAADLLSQAEHGADSQVLLVTNSAALAVSIENEVALQLLQLPRKAIAKKALKNSKAIIVNTIDEAIELVNEYAAEHLIICCKDADGVAEKITNAGSVFIGNYSPESVGDYASGTNHTLPTNGYARAYSGVSVDSFVKKVTFQKLSKEGLQAIGKTVELMAVAEGLEAHAEAVRVRREG